MTSAPSQLLRCHSDAILPPERLGPRGRWSLTRLEAARRLCDPRAGQQAHLVGPGLEGRLQARGTQCRRAAGTWEVCAQGALVPSPSPRASSAPTSQGSRVWVWRVSSDPAWAGGQDGACTRGPRVLPVSGRSGDRTRMRVLASRCRLGAGGRPGGSQAQAAGENPGEGPLSGWGWGCQIFQGGASQSASPSRLKGAPAGADSPGPKEAVARGWHVPRL